MRGKPPSADVLEDLLAARGERLLRTAILLTGSKEAGEDLLQTALERLLRNWASIRGHHVISISPTASCGNPLGMMTASPVIMAAQLREWVSCGVLKLGETREIDGVQAIGLTGTEHGLTVTYWVDAGSYLPVRVSTTFDVSPRPVSVQDDLRWLPPTPANLALLTVPVPAGFTEVQPPSLSD